MGQIMFRHRKLVVVTWILLSYMLGEPHLSFDRSVPFAILYLLTKNKEILNVGS